MTAQNALILEVTPEERKRIEQSAQAHGYDNARDYLLALVEADNELEDTPDEEIVADLREALADALAGRTRPARDVLKEIRDKLAHDEDSR